MKEREGCDVEVLELNGVPKELGDSHVEHFAIFVAEIKINIKLELHLNS